jgi:hypothetical protein
MSKLVLLGGPTGVGKTTALALLADRFERSAFLDADDVWRISPDLAVEGTRRIAIANVISIMRGYYEAKCELGVLSWVFARPQLFKPVIEGIRDVVDSVHQVYLVCSPTDLEHRLTQRGQPDRIPYAKSRLSLISDLPYVKIDTSGCSPVQVADLICDEIERLDSG